MSTPSSYLSQSNLNETIVGIELNKQTHVTRLYCTDEIATYLNASVATKFYRLIRNIYILDPDCLKIVFFDNNNAYLGNVHRTDRDTWRVEHSSSPALAQINAKRAKRFMARAQWAARMQGVDVDELETPAGAIAGASDRAEVIQDAAGA
jgi:hypothetical protein